MTAYKSTMTPEEEARWVAGGGKPTWTGIAVGELPEPVRRKPPRPDPMTNRCPKCGAPITIKAKGCRDCAYEARRKEPFTPITDLPAQQLEDMHRRMDLAVATALAVPEAAFSQIPETAKAVTPDVTIVTRTVTTDVCRFCGAPTVDADRCERHDVLWRKLKGLPAQELARLADEALP